MKQLHSHTGIFTRTVLLFSVAAIAVCGSSQERILSDFDPGATSQSRLWKELMWHDADWFKSPAAADVAETVLLYQRGSGGWPKNIDFRAALGEQVRKELVADPQHPHSTIDNGATYTQLFFLMEMYGITGRQDYAAALQKGIGYLLEAQYPNGGWPQFFPLRKGYYSHVTFNDDAMVGVLRLLSAVADRQDEFPFLSDALLTAVTQSLKAGLACILKTQLTFDGNLSGWCAQYDPVTLKPARARNYEHPSVSGKATVGIVQFLMSIENPDPEVIAAVEGAVAWFERSRIEGIRLVRKADPSIPQGYDRLVVADTNAPSIWARFYSLESNEPFFSDRDGKIYHELAAISAERRLGYAWLGYWPVQLLEEYYPAWRERWVTRK